MGLTRPQRLQQARTASHNQAAAANASVLRAASYYYFGISFCGLVCGISAQRPNLTTQVEALVGLEATTAALRRRRGQKTAHFASAVKQRSRARAAHKYAATQDKKCSPPSRKQRRN